MKKQLYIFKMKKFLLSVLMMIVFLPASTLAQTYSISGTITDTHNNPLPHVNVILTGTGLGAASDINGHYKIENVKPGKYTIVFSAIGYKKLKIEDVTVDKPVTLNVILKEEIIKAEEIIVTASKYEQKKSDLPVSVEIIKGTNLTERNYFNMEDALRYVPGVNMTDDQISIRGSGGYSRGAGARALLAIDGLPFYTGDTGEIVWEMIPVTEIQRVEIIKGAASSMYGSSAIGGVINSITRDITNYPQTRVNGFYGVYDKPYYSQWDWSGERRPFNGLTLSHSNTFGKFGFNISFSRLENSGYRQNDYSKKYIGFLKAVYKFTPKSSLMLLANTFNKRADTFIYWKDSQNALRPPDRNLGEKIETNRYLFGLVFKDVISDKVFMNVKASYYHNNWEDNSIQNNVSTSGLYRGEIQINSSLTNNLFLITGVEGISSNVNSSIFGNPSSYTVAGYAQLDISFNFPLKLSLGFRYDYTRLDTLKGSDALSPKLGLNYKLLKNLILRSSLSTGFRAPTLAEAFTSTSTYGITVKPNPNLRSESNLTFEVGINYDLPRLVNFDVAAFHNEYYDMIEPGIDPTDGFAVFDNVVRARIQGFEFNTVIQIIPDMLDWRLSYTYLWARDLDMNKALKYRPRHLFYSTLDFTISNFTFGVDFRYWSRVDEIDEELVDLGIVPDGDLRVPVYVTDLRASYNLISLGLPLQFYLNAKNIFNYNYVELIGNLKPIRNFSLGFNLVL